jgi:two-component system sensor histidine kinase UhpB
MSLRLRIALLNGLLLLASIALGALITGFEVRKVLGEELAAALAGARQTAASAFEDLPRSDHPARDLRQLVGTFDGNRHVRASLVAPRGGSVWTSRSDDPGAPPPSWFRHMVEVAPGAARLPVPPTTFGPAVLVLTPTPGVDVRAAWGEFSTLMIMFATMAAIGLLLVYLAIGAALKPLTVLALRFRQIGAGDYSGRVAETGPPELEHLQHGFNRMADELEDTTGRNRLLTEYVAKLQEEERAEIARDLHDEIGPHLFAVNLDAEMIAQLGATSGQGGIAERAREIQGSVQYMQRHVRDLLGRLRPTQVTEFGLAAAIEELVRFWSDRRPAARPSQTGLPGFIAILSNSNSSSPLPKICLEKSRSPTDAPPVMMTRSLASSAPAPASDKAARSSRQTMRRRSRPPESVTIAAIPRLTVSGTAYWVCHAVPGGASSSPVAMMVMRG